MAEAAPGYAVVEDSISSVGNTEASHLSAANIHMSSFQNTDSSRINVNERFPSELQQRESNFTRMFSRLNQEAELHKLIADEKLRNEQHKLNFHLLKAEHSRLQLDYESLKEKLKQLIDESKQTIEGHKDALQKTRKELAQKQVEVQQLKNQVMTSQQIEMVKLQAHEEAEKSFRERYAILEDEAERYRSDFNKLRYEFTFLKAEYEHSSAENQRILEEIKLKHEAELSALEQEKASLQSSLQAQLMNPDADHLSKLQREIYQLQQKIKALRAELEELQAQKDYQTQQTESIQRLQVKQLAEHEATVKAIELEKSNLQSQMDRLRREVTSTSEMNIDLKSQIYQANKEVSELKHKLQEVEYNSRLEASNVQVEWTKQKGELEREKDKVVSELERTKAELEAAHFALDLKNKKFAEQEREYQKRIQLIQQEDWVKINHLESEKLELEAQLEKCEGLITDKNIHGEAALKHVEEQLSTAMQEKLNLEKELSNLRKKPIMIESREDQDIEIANLKQELSKFKKELQGLIETVEELAKQNQQLHSNLEASKQESKEKEKVINKEKADYENIMIQQQVNWEEQRQQLRSRISDLEHRLSQVNARHSGDRHKTISKLKKYRGLIKKLRNKLYLLKAQVGEMETEKEILKKNVPYDVHRETSKQLRMFQRHHQELQHLLSAIEQTEFTEVAGQSASVHHITNWFKSIGSANANQVKEIQDVKERMSALDEKQRQQMIDLLKIESQESAQEYHHVPENRTPDSISEIVEFDPTSRGNAFSTPRLPMTKSCPTVSRNTNNMN